MNKTVKLPEELLKEVKRYANVYHRSVPKQIEHWTRLGKIVEENPDLPYEFIKGILISLEEAEAGEVEEYKFG